MKKNVAGQAIGAQMVSATDGSAFTGAVTVYVTGDGGAQGVGSVGAGACTHEGNGYHTYAPAQAETNYDLVAFSFVGSGAVPATVQVYTGFPQSADGHVATIANGAITAAAIATGAIDADALAADATTELQSGLATAAELAKVPKSDSNVSWNATALAAIQQEATDALEAAITDSIPADGALPSVKQAAYMLIQRLTEVGIVGTTLTVYKADGTTPLYTLTLGDATNPTTMTRAS